MCTSLTGPTLALPKPPKAQNKERIFSTHESTCHAKDWRVHVQFYIPGVHVKDGIFYRCDENVVVKLTMHVLGHKKQLRSLPCDKQVSKLCCRPSNTQTYDGHHNSLSFRVISNKCTLECLMVSCFVIEGRDDRFWCGEWRMI
jgi:hypothetical protein